jgi:hypothetical protein
VSSPVPPVICWLKAGEVRRPLSAIGPLARLAAAGLRGRTPEPAGAASCAACKLASFRKNYVSWSFFSSIVSFYVLLEAIFMSPSLRIGLNFPQRPKVIYLEQKRNMSRYGAANHHRQLKESLRKVPKMDIGTYLGLAGILLAIFGLAIAIPPFIQMWRGRPQLLLGVDDFTGPDGKSLFVTFRNKTIPSRFLKKLGVIREAGDVTGSFDIQELGTGKFVAKDISGRLHNSVLRESGLMARAYPGRTVGMTIIHQIDHEIWVFDGRATPGDQNLPKIPPGDYAVRAIFICGEEIYSITRQLKVGSAPHLTNWI